MRNLDTRTNAVALLVPVAFSYSYSSSRI